MLTLVSTLVTVIVAFGTTEPLVSLTSPVIVAVSCCASAKGEQSAISPKSNMGIKSLVFIRGFLRWGKGLFYVADQICVSVQRAAAGGLTSFGCALRHAHG